MSTGEQGHKTLLEFNKTAKLTSVGTEKANNTMSSFENFTSKRNKLVSIDEQKVQIIQPTRN